MKKAIIGFICGFVLAGATVAYGSEAVKAFLFPVQYEIDGEKQELPEGYYTLNVEGRVYVPIRYAAESMDAVVIYDEAGKTVRIDRGYTLGSFDGYVKAGYLGVAKDEGTSIVTGKLYAGQRYWEALSESKFSVEAGTPVELKANIAFYGEDGRLLGKAPVRINCKAEGDQVKDFKALADADVSGYAFAALEEVQPEPIYAFLPPSLDIKDPSGLLAAEVTDMQKSGDYTRLRLRLGFKEKGLHRAEAVLTFYDGSGKLLGTADIKFSGHGTYDAPAGEPLAIYSYETAGKGDFTSAASYSLHVKVYKPEG